MSVVNRILVSIDGVVTLFSHCGRVQIYGPVMSHFKAICRIKTDMLSDP